MTWHVYTIAPIDIGWEHLPSIDQVLFEFKKADDWYDTNASGSNSGTSDALRASFEHAKALAEDAGWEGDFRPHAAPRVFFLPFEKGFRHAFVWKQDNNGTTFVISPLPLVWLEAK